MEWSTDDLEARSCKSSSDNMTSEVMITKSSLEALVK